MENINGAFVLGAELTDLIEIYPGPYAAKVFIIKMLRKCKKTVEEKEISLCDFIEEQEEVLREKILDTYGKGSWDRLLPILAATKESLTVDEKKAWIPAYRKAWIIQMK